MRRYEKPVMQVERYVAKNAVATGCYLQDATKIGKQTVDCIINGSEEIYTSAVSCKSSGSSQAAFVTYEGTLYYVWYNGDVAGQPSASATATLNKILSEAYGQNKDSWGPGYHAGTVTAETYKEMNSTS